MVTEADTRNGRAHVMKGSPSLRLPQDPFRLLLFLLMVLTLSRVHQALGLGFLRPGLTLAALASLYAFLNPGAVTTRPFRTWPVALMAIMAAAACLSVPFGLSIGSSGSYFLTSYAKVLLFAALLVLAVRSARDIYFFMIGWVVANAILVWLSFFVFRLSSAGSLTNRLGNMYGYDANDNGLLLVVGIPLGLLVFRMSGWLGRLAIGVVLSGAVATIALTGSRGAFLALACVSLALLFFLDGMSILRRLIVLGCLGLVLWVGAPKGYWAQMETILSPKEDYNWSADTGRRAIAKRGLGYMMDYPFFGIGLHNFARAEGTISSVARNAMPGKGVPWLAPHNSYVQAGAEMGVAGGVAFLGLVLGGIVGMARLRRRAPRAWAQGDAEERFLYIAPLYLSISYLGFAVAAFFLSFAYLDPIYILSALSAGLYACTRSKLRELQAYSPSLLERAPGMRGGGSLVAGGG